MKRLFTILISIFITFSVAAQAEKSIVIEQKSFRAVQTDALTGVNIDPIGLDYSKRPCARLKVKINRMTKAEIDGIEVKLATNNQLTKCKTAEYDNGLIIEMTAKPQTRFYFHHDEFGDSNEVCLDLEAGKEYYLEAYLNQLYSIVVMSNIADAEVFIDDVLQGRTDTNNQCSIRDVLPGKHTLKIQSGATVAQNIIEVHGANFFFKLDLPTAANSVKYKIGDYYNDGVKEGVVFEVTPDGKHGKIVSMKYSNTEFLWASEEAEQRKIVGASDMYDGSHNMRIIQNIPNWRNKYQAFAWCNDLGEGWYLPAVKELEILLTDSNLLDSINRTLIVQGGDTFRSDNQGAWIWTSTEDKHNQVEGYYFAWGVSFLDKEIFHEPKKWCEHFVRAVAKF